MKEHLTTRSLALAVMLCVGGLTTEGLAQLPVVTFENGSTTLITYGPAGNTVVLPANEPGKFYFALLTSSAASGPFTFAGAYGTNSASAGRIAVYSPYVVPGWAPCVTMFYEVAGWSSDLGATWNPRWLMNNAPASPADSVWGRGGYFGLSGIAIGGGGCDEPAPIPPWPLFGGSGLRGSIWLRLVLLNSTLKLYHLTSSLVGQPTLTIGFWNRLCSSGPQPVGSLLRITARSPARI